MFMAFQKDILVPFNIFMKACSDYLENLIGIDFSLRFLENLQIFETLINKIKCFFGCLKYLVFTIPERLFVRTMKVVDFTLNRIQQGLLLAYNIFDSAFTVCDEL